MGLSEYNDEDNELIRNESDYIYFKMGSKNSNISFHYLDDLKERGLLHYPFYLGTEPGYDREDKWHYTNIVLWEIESDLKELIRRKGELSIMLENLKEWG